AADIPIETARLWASLGFWGKDRDGGQSFHIHGVTGPDEYTTVVNDNLFTNVMARFNLRFAVEVVRRLEAEAPHAYARLRERLHLDPAEVEAWAHAADGMYIPYSEELGIHPQDDHFLEREVWDLAATPPEQKPLLLHFHPLVIYRFQVLKQADVVLALLLASHEFGEGPHAEDLGPGGFGADGSAADGSRSDASGIVAAVAAEKSRAQKRRDFEYYDALTTGDSTLSAVVQSIIAAEVGYRELAYRYFEHALRVDLDDLHRNSSDGAHVASAGGVWMQLVQGFAGMRDGVMENAGRRLSFDPRLPAHWGSLSFRLQWRGSTIEVLLERHRIRFEMLEPASEVVSEARDEAGGAVTVSVRGQRIEIGPGAPVEVALEDQGPDLGPFRGLSAGILPRDGEGDTGAIPELDAEAFAALTGPIPIPTLPPTQPPTLPPPAWGD
ncbi:MAG: glycosyl hydrolase family 65 protein, partial [Leucobacter sp.]